MRIFILFLLVVWLQGCLPQKNSGLPPELINKRLDELQHSVLEVEDEGDTNKPTEIVSTMEEKSEYCLKLSKELSEAFQDINYCEVDEDCKVAQGVCPFGCYFLYHKKIPFESYAADIEAYRKKCKPCQYQCAARDDLGEVKCITGKCIISDTSKDQETHE